MATVNKTFRIFVSSTFSDLKEERNALQRDVFPELKKLCMQHGYRFQAIDLRWGVREESALDQQTMNICLDEVARCQRPPNPNFIVLLGDRYGWQPLPAEIPASEYEQLEKHVSNEKEKALLKRWYKRDDNAVPAVYSLQPREVKVKVNAPDSEKKSSRDEERKLWEKIETSLRRILRIAIEKTALTDDQKFKYNSSATEQEIEAGALNVPDAEEHVFGFFRKIEGLPQDESVKGYTDLISKGEITQIDTDAQGKLDKLKRKLIKKSGKDNIFEYKAEWKGNDCTNRHIKKLCDDVYNSLSGIIEKEIDLIEELFPLEREIVAQMDFAEVRAKQFVGRGEILNKIQDYFSKTEKHPLVVYGDSGTGKSALMAHALQQPHEGHPDSVVIFRFIGATPESTNGRALLESLCRQISLLYNVDESDIPTDYKDLIVEFPKRLALATAENPLILALDALDQLSETNSSKNLIWLPADLPENVWLMVSTLPGECFEALKRKLPEENLLELQPMLSDEGEQLLDLWLNDVGRVLQVPQRKEIFDHFNQKDNGNPLYLKLAFEESRGWKSYTEGIKLSPDISGVIQDLFKRLSSDENHGEMLVSRSLGYLAAAKNGLTEDELIEVLSEDKEVFDDFTRRAYHKPPEKRLPVVIWSRLYFDLEPYLTEYSADGTSLMTFYHPTTFGAQVKEEYLSGKTKLLRHQGLGEYFGNQSLYNKRDNEKTTNLRKLSELPFQLSFSNNWTELCNTLTDTEFLEQKNTLMSIYEVLEDYRTAIEMMPMDDEIGKQHSELQAFSNALDTASFVLKENPELTFPQLYNRLQWGFDDNIFLKTRLESEKQRFHRPWLHLITQPAGRSALIRTFTGHTDVVKACDFSPDGKHIVSASDDYKLKLWDTKTGREITAFSGHTSYIESCAYSPDGKYIVSASWDKTLKLWDAKNGEEVFTLRGHTGSVLCCAFNPDGRSIVSGSEDKTLMLWDTEKGEEIFTLESHLIAVEDCGFSPDGKIIISASGTLKLWDRETGDEIYKLTGFNLGVHACAFSPDGKRIVTGSGYTLNIWNAETYQKIFTLKGHSAEVSSCAFSPNGKLIVSGSHDSTLKLWNAETGMEISTFRGHSWEVWGCSFSPDGIHIISASNDKTLKLWDTTIKEEVPDFKGHKYEVTACVFSPDGKRFLSASEDKTLILWDAKTGREISILKGHSGGVKACSFSPDGKRIISGCSIENWKVHNNLKVWDGMTGEEVFTLRGHKDSVEACCFSPDGKLMLSASSDKTLKLWDSDTGEEISSHTGHTEFGGVVGCIFSPDGRHILSASTFKNLKLWDAETRKEISTLKGNSVPIKTGSFSPDGRRIVSGGKDKAIKLWDAETGIEISTVKYHRLGSARSCVFSPNGRRIVSRTEDMNLKLWDAKNGEEVFTLRGHHEKILACDFSPDGHHIVSTSEDKTLKLWSAETGKEITTFKGHTDIIDTYAISPEGSHLVLGDETGQVLLTCIENVELFAPIVSPVRTKHLSNKTQKAHWDENLKATCLCCGQSFLISDDILDTIREIYRKANLAPAQFTSLQLPDATWEDPRLLSECPLCHKPLRFNPFIVDNKDLDPTEPTEKSVPEPETKKEDQLFPFNQDNTYLDELKPDVTGENADVHYNLAEKNWQDGKIEEAIQEYKEAIRIDPDHVSGHFNLGCAYQDQNRLKEAKHEFKEVIRIDPISEDAHCALGIVFGTENQHQDAIEEYKIAIQINGDHSLSHFNLGSLYMKLGNKAKAKYHFKRALDLGYEEARPFLKKWWQF